VSDFVNPFRRFEFERSSPCTFQHHREANMSDREGVKREDFNEDMEEDERLEREEDAEEEEEEEDDGSSSRSEDEEESEVQPKSEHGQGLNGEDYVEEIREVIAKYNENPLELSTYSSGGEIDAAMGIPAVHVDGVGRLAYPLCKEQTVTLLGVKSGAFWERDRDSG